jgi:hypothetical protein
MKTLDTFDFDHLPEGVNATQIDGTRRRQNELGRRVEALMVVTSGGRDGGNEGPARLLLSSRQGYRDQLSQTDERLVALLCYGGGRSRIGPSGYPHSVESPACPSAAAPTASFQSRSGDEPRARRSGKQYAVDDD